MVVQKWNLVRILVQVPLSSVHTREVWVRGLDLDLESEVLAFEDCIREVIEMRRHESALREDG